ncbi:MAG: D-alanyl-D-alanine carboxypeptidase [Oscillospiraceae bacterium]|jgi:D-alanyl-D-alanine carboxypeptidase (penicillin-binding protein 5/6)|nr:D-alanyl-D-alanine carboxypeptidase [Oscillospiraceae bacterium]
MKSFLRRCAAIFLVLVLLACLTFGAWADVPGKGESNTENTGTEKEGITKSAAENNQNSETPPVEIHAKAAILMDAASGTILARYHENDRLYPASVTKIMPLLLIGEALDSGKIHLTDQVTASATAASKGGSQIWLKEGETMTVEELLKATAIYSANDACTALGEYLAGSDEAFVRMMNARAAQLGMTNTHFDNCTGLDDETETHLTSAYDIALMSRELLKHDVILQFTTIWMDSLREGTTELVNTNRLVRFYEGTTGLKTGTTSKAGCCLSATARRFDTHLIAVVLGSGNSDERFETAKALLNWGFANFESVTYKVDQQKITPVRVLRGMTETIQPLMGAVTPVLVPKGRAADLQCTMDLSLDVAAPVEAGQILGNVRLTLDGQEMGSFPLTAPANVPQINYATLLRRLLGALCSANFTKVKRGGGSNDLARESDFSEGKRFTKRKQGLAYESRLEIHQEKFNGFKV